MCATSFVLTFYSFSGLIRIELVKSLSLCLIWNKFILSKKYKFNICYKTSLKENNNRVHYMCLLGHKEFKFKFCYFNVHEYLNV